MLWRATATLLGLDRRRRLLGFSLVSAAALATCGLQFPFAKAACGDVFLLGLIAATCVDLDQMIIPDMFSVGLALAGVALSAGVPSLHGLGAFGAFPCLRSAAAALLGVALGSALGLWISILGELALNREVLGFGDIKFLGAIGAFCGWQGAVFAVFGGSVIGAIALAGAALHGRLSSDRSPPLFRLESPDGQSARVGWGVQFPFGPMLAAAAGLYFLVLHPWVDRVLNVYAMLF